MARTPTLALLGLPLLAAVATAQTGPFVDGELLVRVDDLGPDTLYRIDPLTGTAATLATDLVGGYGDGGWVAYDSHRDGVLAYTATHATGISSPRLFLIREDGGLSDLLGETSGFMRSLAPVGDGRVYLRQGGQLMLLDAANVLSPVLDHQGQPITMDLEHLVYDGPTDSLIGVASAYSTTLPCDGMFAVSIHRLPLAPSGTQLAGPALCNSLTTYSTSPIGLEHFAGGNLLLTFADKHQFQPNSMIEVDPVTLAGTIWASTNLPDLNGGVWCDPLNAAVVWDDWNNELRTFTAGHSGSGTVLPTSIQVGGGTTGTSPRNGLADVDFQGTPCAGFVLSLGTGSPGLGGRVPLLGIGSCPALGSTMPVTISNGRQNELAYLVFSARQTALPLFGGTLYVRPPFVETRLLMLTGGGGFARVDFLIPNDPSVAGVSFFGQAAVRDSQATGGWSLTQAVELQVQ